MIAWCVNLMESGYSRQVLETEIPKSSWILGTAQWIPGAEVEWCLIIVLASIFVAHSLLPAWQTLKSEFPNYYLAAELYHNNVPLDRVYEWTWFQRQNDHWAVRDGLVSFAPNPPTFVLAVLPLASLSALTAKRVWLVLSLAFLALSLFALRQVTSLCWRRLILIMLLCIFPLSVDFIFARPYALILLFICAAYYAACHHRHFGSGALWSAAAGMKLFPVLSLIYFVRTRNSRALAGFLVGGTMLLTLSIFLFGAEVHRVFLREVLTQASRGDWLGPYVLSQNSFVTLWSHLFLVEPELNPSPLINSPILYALVSTLTVVVLVFAFLRSFTNSETAQTRALHWASLVPLMLLLSTTTAPDYSCLLIFSVIIGVDALLAAGDNKKSYALLFLYIAACAPVPARILNWFPLTRLTATTALYVLLLHQRGMWRVTKLWWAAALISAAVLTTLNFRLIRDRAEDFSRRLPVPSNGYRSGNPVSIGSDVAFTEMKQTTYEIALLTGGVIAEIPTSGDALSLTSSESGNWIYAELAGRRSFIVRLPMERLGSVSEVLVEGQEPAISVNGKWLAFIREEQGRGTAFLSAPDAPNGSVAVLPSRYQPLDVTVTNDGDVIAAAGNVSDPHLLFVKHSTKEIATLPAFPHPARYPSISPDGKWLAFSRRDNGFWHLMVHAFATGDEQQLTRASCNAISPSWVNNRTVLYATDCGRGVGLSAIAKFVLPN
ncbi:MAG TPA: glycosyltransferase 87 family protein [Terriglobales bacterium]|nr:glycosyltransferase 87 family protein [Terriglobales bacterium]